MKTYDVQDIEIAVPAATAFEVIIDPAQLPRWTEAFASAGPESAVLKTPNGSVSIALRVDAHRGSGVVDWKMTFPDGSSGWAHSRVMPLTDDRCLFTFVLHAPPVPLATLEGALDAQRKVLARELRKLKTLLESR